MKRCKKRVKIPMQFNDHSTIQIFVNLLILEEIC
jgi:hypothetical protein